MAADAAAPSDDVLVAAHVTFGANGNAAPFQGEGFSWPEDGYTWALGPAAMLRVGLRPGEGDLMLELSLRPFMAPPFLVRQRIGLAVQGSSISTEWAQDDTVLGFRIPAALVRGRDEIELRLDLPDAVSPAALQVASDTRRLAAQMREALLVWIPPAAPFAPRRLAPLPIGPDDTQARLDELSRFCTGLALDQLMLNFESLGQNCEFGLVQRACGAEPQGLLRYVGISINRLLNGLDFGFDGVDDPALLRTFAGPGATPEWLLQHDRYGMTAHSFQRVEAIGAAEMLEQYVQRLRFQRRRFLEVLESGQNLFVFQREAHMTEAHALPLLTMLRSYGPNALLFVTMEPDAPSGSVDLLGAHLYRGNIEKLAPVQDARQFELASWVSICANAYRLWRETGHGG
jgi:hypothetical protein